MEKDTQVQELAAGDEPKQEHVIHGSDHELIEVGDGEGITLINEEPKPKEETPAEAPVAEATKPNDGEPTPLPAKQEEQRQRPKKSAQERINEIARERYEATERAAAAEAALELAREELNKLRNSAVAADEKALDEKAKDAIDRGDMPAYHAAMQEMVDLRVKKAMEARSQPKEEPAPKAAPSQTKPQQPQMEDLGDGLMVYADTDPNAKVWIKANPWIGKPENKHLADAAARIEGQIFRKYGAYSAQVYEELDAELDKLAEFDSVRGKVEPAPAAQPPAPQPVQTQQRPAVPPRSTVSPPAPTAGQPEPPQGKQLTEYDKKQMKMYGLDPNDKKHRDAYLRRKS